MKGIKGILEAFRSVIRQLECHYLLIFGLCECVREYVSRFERGYGRGSERGCEGEGVRTRCAWECVYVAHYLRE